MASSGWPPCTENSYETQVGLIGQNGIDVIRMPAYYRATIDEFLRVDPVALVGKLETQYANDGFVTQFVSQTQAWADLIPLLKQELCVLMNARPHAASWGLLLEFPLYRLRKRIDIVILTEAAVIVVEAKVGEDRFYAADERQVEESLDRGQA